MTTRKQKVKRVEATEGKGEVVVKVDWNFNLITALRQVYVLRYSLHPYTDKKHFEIHSIEEANFKWGEEVLFKITVSLEVNVLTNVGYYMKATENTKFDSYRLEEVEAIMYTYMGHTLFDKHRESITAVLNLLREPVTSEPEAPVAF